jgi:hypothetical protein
VYYDVPYYLVALIVSTGFLVEKTLKAEADEERARQREPRRPAVAAARKALA